MTTTTRSRTVPAAYINEMNVLVQNAIEEQEGGWVAATLANKLVEQLRASDPDLLRGWLDLQAENLIRAELTRVTNSQRSRSRSRAAAVAFNAAAREAERTGDYSQLTGLFTVTHVVSNDNMRRQAKDMTGRDHLFVARRYHGSANEFLTLSAFHEAVAREVGDRKTSDVYDNATYERLYRSIVRTAV
jgi:hypothetical protein